MNRLFGLMIAVLALQAALAAGCESTVREGPRPGVRVADPRAPYATVRMNTVAVIDPALLGGEKKAKSKVAVEASSARRTPTDTLEVWATLRNRTDYPLQLEARTQFFDRDEVPIEGPTAWKRLHLPPNGVAAYKEASTRVDVGYYYVEVREGK